MVSFAVEDIDQFKYQLVVWANQFPIFCLLDTNQVKDTYGKYDFIIGIDSLWNYSSIEELPNDEFSFGYISYPNANNHSPFIAFETVFFFRPRYVIYAKNNRIFINRNSIEALEIKDAVEKIALETNKIFPHINFECRTAKSQYIENIHKIQEAISNGQFYELNYCIEFFNENAKIDPISTFTVINKMAQSPMSALLKQRGKWVLSFSPERLLALRDNQLISQPIKGTARRNLKDTQADENIKIELSQSLKERAENTMIVDLTRHDITPYAETGSIKVEELCKIYTYPFVHQMISTITAKLKCVDNAKKALQHLLPAGSMTGAPKGEVMKYIDAIEDFTRGVYAGNIGYWDADGDFDFNVVIRSLYYDDNSHKISLAVGGAITLMSDAEKEYQECLLKAEGILNFFR